MDFIQYGGFQTVLLKTSVSDGAGMEMGEPGEKKFHPFNHTVLLASACVH